MREHKLALAARHNPHFWGLGWGGIEKLPIIYACSRRISAIFRGQPWGIAAGHLVNKTIVN